MYDFVIGGSGLCFRASWSSSDDFFCLCLSQGLSMKVELSQLNRSMSTRNSSVSESLMMRLQACAVISGNLNGF